MERPHCSSLEGDSAQPLASACGRRPPKSNGFSALPHCRLSGNRVVSILEPESFEMQNNDFVVVLVGRKWKEEWKSR